MATLDLRKSVLNYVKSADDRFLKLVKAMAESYNEDEDNRIGIEQYNKEMDASEKEIEAGNFHTHEQVRHKIDEWGKE